MSSMYCLRQSEFILGTIRSLILPHEHFPHPIFPRRNYKTPNHNDYMFRWLHYINVPFLDRLTPKLSWLGSLHPISFILWRISISFAIWGQITHPSKLFHQKITLLKLFCSKRRLNTPTAKYIPSEGVFSGFPSMKPI